VSEVGGGRGEVGKREWYPPNFGAKTQKTDDDEVDEDVEEEDEDDEQDVDQCEDNKEEEEAKTKRKRTRTCKRTGGVTDDVGQRSV